MLEDELLKILRSLSDEGACYYSASDVDFPDVLPGSDFRTPYYPVQRHWSHVEMIRLIHGEMALHVNGQWLHLKDSRLRVFLHGTAHTEHYFSPDRPYTLLWLTIVSGGINLHRTGYTPAGGYYQSRERERISSPVAPNLWRCASESSPFRPRFHYLLMESIDHTLRNRNFGIDGADYRKNVLGEIKEFLDEYYWKQLSISDLGAMTHFSPPYLNRMFKKRYDISLHDYLAQLRMEHAAGMLRDELSVPVGKIAAAVGIADQRYFSRCFRNRYGLTPGEYREAHSKKASGDA